MKRSLPWLLVVLLTVAAWSAPHPLKLAYLVPANRSRLHEYVSPDTAAIFVQVPALTDDEAAALLGWVEGGGSLWFSDCRLANRFGMEAAPVDLAAVNGASVQQYEYGGVRHVKLLAAVLYAATEHPVVDGLSFEHGFLLAVDPTHVSAVKAGGDVLGLMRLTTNPEDPHNDQVVAALRTVGKGNIVFRPVVTDGTFEYNLEHWIASQYDNPTASPGGPTTAPTAKP